MADDYFTILTGEQKSVMPHHVEAMVFGPGQQNHMKRGDGNQYVLKGYALELAQGKLLIQNLLPGLGGTGWMDG